MASIGPAPPSTLPVEDAQKEAFLKWCTDNRVTIHPSIDLFHNLSPGYRGVLAVEDIPKDTELLRISRNSCLGPATIDDTKDEWREIMLKHNRYQPAAKEGEPKEEKPEEKADSSAPTLTTACFTVLRVLHEQGLGDKSPFAAYLAILPKQHRIPLEWNEAEKTLLRGTAAEPYIAVDSQTVGSHGVLHKLAQEHPNLWDKSVQNAAALAKATNWVRSRGFTLEGGQPYLIPCADAFNHNPQKQSVAFAYDPADSDTFVMRTLKPVKMGAELFSSFGQLSNAQLIVSYGFVLKNNPFDSVSLPGKVVLEGCKTMFLKLDPRITAEQALVNWQGRLEQLRQNNILVNELDQFHMTKYDMVPTNVLETIQSALLTEDELTVYGAMMNVLVIKMRQYDPIFETAPRGAAAAAAAAAARAANPGVGARADSIGADALAVAKALVAEEKKFLMDLYDQLKRECIMMGDEDVPDDGELDEESDDSSYDEIDSRKRGTYSKRPSGGPKRKVSKGKNGRY